MGSEIPGVTAVVVNYNGAACIAQCLESLHREPLVRQIVMVDNGSIDGSCQWVREKFPKVLILAAGKNLGFGRACNLGAKAAHEPFLLLLNCDGILDGGVSEAQEYLLAHPGTAVVGGRLSSPGQGPSQPSVGLPHTPARLVLSWVGLSRWSKKESLFTREILDEEFYSKIRQDVAWVSGALMMIRGSVWEMVAGMDPGYFLYLEDVDFCDRVRKSGWGVDYLPELRATHLPRGGAKVVSRVALLSTVDSMFFFTVSRSGNLVARVVLAAIGAIFSLRGLVLGLRFWRARLAFREGRVFLGGAWRALQIAAGKKFPWGPPC